MTTTWDSGKKSANITLSNFNLTATDSSGGFDNVLAVNGASSGKYYWEVNMDNVGSASAGVGIGNASIALTSAPNTVANTAIWNMNGNLNINGSFDVNFGTWTTGDRIDMALDLGNNNIWFRKNGGSWNPGTGSSDPATNLNGQSLSVNGAMTGPFYACGGLAISDVQTAHFSTSSWVGTAPSGFTEWNPSATGPNILSSVTNPNLPVLPNQYWLISPMPPVVVQPYILMGQIWL